jgi:hypothetical protein
MMYIGNVSTMASKVSAKYALRTSASILRFIRVYWLLISSIDSLPEQFGQPLFRYIRVQDTGYFHKWGFPFGIIGLASPQTGSPLDIAEAQQFGIEEILIQQQIGTPLYKTSCPNTNLD